MTERILREKKLAVRHSAVELIEHWTIALSGLVLLVSGMFELPMAQRYYFTSIPGLAWSGDFITSLYVHYVASVFFVGAALFHVIHHGLLGDRGLLPVKGDLKASAVVMKSFFGKGEEPPFGKYPPEQRLAYIGMALIIALLILSGLVKTFKNVYAPDMNYSLVLWATWVHNVAFVLFILALVGHIGALVLKPNRPMVRGILTGAVRLDYAMHRHPLWIKALETSGAPETLEVKDVPELPEQPGTTAGTEQALSETEETASIPSGSNADDIDQEPEQASPSEGG